MVKKILKSVFSFCIIIILFLIIMVNVKLHYSPARKIVEGDTINYDLLKELRGLKNSLNEDADIEMQRLYPEGYMFLNVVYGLAWCNFMERQHKESELFREGQTEIRKVWRKINSDQCRSQFDEELPLPYGAFYTGWSTYFLGRKLNLESADKRNEAEVIQFKQQCEQISFAIKQRIYPASYYGSAWPADVILCIASLSLHDRIFEAKYTDRIGSWLDQIKSKLDPHGLIPHAVNPLSGASIENARGSSQSLMLIFFREIDERFARQQFSVYKANFVDSKFGLTGIRECAKDDFGIGDVDSGPVILQFGSAATIVGMQTLSLYGEHETSTCIRNTVEALSFPFKNDDQKTYLFGLLPMADAFIAWGHSAQMLDSPHLSFTTFHLYSGFICIALGVCLWVMLKSR